ncbi:MAG: DUF1549 domain-containing protein [Planctomycetota bacterium]
MIVRQPPIHTCYVALTALVAVYSGVVHAASPDAGKKPPRPTQRIDLSAFPPAISLNAADDFQSFVAVKRNPNGTSEDVTARLRWSVADPKLAKIDGVRLLPIADGTTQLIGRDGDSEVRIDVTIQNASSTPPVSFIKDVMPTLTRAGCNTGSCHGAARGKDGFNLSLFGFDPRGDHFRVTREIGFRRINLAVPSESLFLKKAVAAVPHSGGKLFDVDSDYYQTIHRWLSAGAPIEAPGEEPPIVESVSVYPEQSVIQGEGATQRLVAVGHYADGTTRDLSRLASFSSNNASVASVDDSGVVTAGARGEAFVMARFDTHTVGVQVLTLPKVMSYEQPETQPSDYIDTLVDKKLHQLRIIPSEQCTDEEFLRRATIDITGLLPTEDEHRQFVNDPSPDKRSELIDRLLERKEFSEIWAMKFAQLLMIKSTNQVSRKSALLYSAWLTDQFARNVPISDMVRDLLTSTGGTFTAPSTNFYEIERDPLKTAENVAQVFMGIRTQCAQCHNHPFDRWTMDDYYGFAAFFRQVGRKQAEDYREKIIYNRASGETKHPVTNQNVAPKFLGGDAPETRGKDRRQVVADWLVAGDNPFFATSIANRVWAHFMGAGIVDPVDDIRVSNPPSNPELFERLGEKLVEYNFDFRALVRDICNSRAYGRSSATNPTNAHDSRNYASAIVRRIPAESLLDCISQITESPDKFAGLPLGSRAVQIADGATTNYFLTTFGRSARTTVCDCEARTDPSLSQALHLLNGESVHRKITAGKIIERWLNADKLSPEEVLERVYVRALSRKPTEEEHVNLVSFLAEEESDPKVVLEDIYWAVLNGREFVFNH